MRNATQIEDPKENVGIAKQFLFHISDIAFESSMHFSNTSYSLDDNTQLWYFGCSFGTGPLTHEYIHTDKPQRLFFLN